MNISEIKINPLFENFLPKLSDEKFQKLESKILHTKNQMVINPLIVWSKDNSLIDGHNRYKIIVAHGLKNFTVTKMDFESESEIMDWMLHNEQDSRDTFTMMELADIGMKLEEQIAKEAEAKLHLATGGDRRSEAFKNQGSRNSDKVEKQDPIRTDVEVAKTLSEISGTHISKDKYRDMKTVRTKGTEEQQNRANKGDRGNSVSAISKEIKDGVPDGYRKCRKCGQVKIVSEFKASETICKECRNIEDRERERIKKESEPVTKPKNNGAYSYAPREGYYDTDAPMNWSFKDVKGEVEHVFQKAINDINFIYQNHVNDVFKEAESVLKFAKEIGKFASQVKFLELEMEKNAGKEESGIVAE